MAQARKCIHKGFFWIFYENSSQWTPRARVNGPPPPFERRNMAPLANGPPLSGGGWYHLSSKAKCKYLGDIMSTLSILKLMQYKRSPGEPIPCNLGLFPARNGCACSECGFSHLSLDLPSLFPHLSRSRPTFPYGQNPSIFPKVLQMDNEVEAFTHPSCFGELKAPPSPQISDT